jgi:hypothetical protein
MIAGFWDKVNGARQIKKSAKFFRKKIRFLPEISSEVHIMQTKHFISPSVTVFRVIGHKNSQSTHIEKNGF